MKSDDEDADEEKLGEKSLGGGSHLRF